MSYLRLWFITILFLISGASCTRPPIVQVSGSEWKTAVDKVCITSIDFYSDSKFTKPMKPHWYMETSRYVTRKLIRERLPDYGLELAECSNDDRELHTKIDICVIGSLLGVQLHLRAKVYHEGKLLFEVTGNAISPPSEKEVIRTQEDLASKVIEKFAEKLGREKR